MNKIDIIIACGRNSERYVKNLIRTIDLTTSKENTFEIFLGINDKSVSKDFLNKIETKHEKRIVDCHSPGSSSYGHGECLDLLLKHTTSEYVVIADADVAFLHKGWDSLLIEELEKDDLVAVIGSEYDGKKYMEFPNVVMCMMKSNIVKEMGISFKPAESRKHKVTEGTSPIFSRRSGDIIDLDTGWELCYKLRMAGYKGIPLPLKRKSAGDECIFLTEGIRGEEHSLGSNVICTHIGRSFTRSFEDPIVKNWKKKVEEWIDGQV